MKSFYIPTYVYALCALFAAALILKQIQWLELTFKINLLS